MIVIASGAMLHASKNCAHEAMALLAFTEMTCVAVVCETVLVKFLTPS